MRRIPDPHTADLIASNRLIVESTRNLIAQSKRECEQLRATIRRSSGLLDEVKDVAQSRHGAK